MVLNRNMELGSRIAAWRHFKGLQQKELAEAVGVTAGAVSQWESGTFVPTHTNIAAVCDALGITMERFFGRVPKKPRAA